MNRSQAKKLLPIMQAFADGKTIQARYTDHEDEWNDQLSIGFYKHNLEWRVKPEPEVIYVNGYKAGARHGFSSEKDALDQIKEEPDYCRTVFIAKKFIEVIE